MIEKTNLVMEKVDHVEGTFDGFVYFTDCPAALRDALRMAEVPPDYAFTIYGTFEINFDDGWPNDLTDVRVYLIRPYSDKFGKEENSHVEFFAYDLIEGGNETLVEKILAGLDYDPTPIHGDVE